MPRCAGLVLDRARRRPRLYWARCSTFSIDIALSRGPTPESDPGRDLHHQRHGLPADGHTIGDIIDPASRTRCGPGNRVLVRSVHLQSITSDLIRALRACRFVAQFDR